MPVAVHAPSCAPEPFVAHHLSRAVRRQPHQPARPAHLRLAVPRRVLPVEPPQMTVRPPGARRDHELLLRHHACRCVDPRPAGGRGPPRPARRRRPPPAYRRPATDRHRQAPHTRAPREPPSQGTDQIRAEIHAKASASIRMFSLIAHEGDAGPWQGRRGRSRSDPAPGRAARSSLTTRRSPRCRTLVSSTRRRRFSEACPEAVASMNSSMAAEQNRAGLRPRRLPPQPDPRCHLPRGRPTRDRPAAGPPQSVGLRVPGRLRTCAREVPPTGAPGDRRGDPEVRGPATGGRRRDDPRLRPPAKQTVSEHQQCISEYLRLRTFDTAASERLTRFLEDEALRLDRT